MSTQPLTRYTPEDYLEYERTAEVKHEYIDGEIVAMAGGSPEHSQITMNVGAALHARLPRGCTVYDSNLRVSPDTSRLHTYPDVTVIYGEPAFVLGTSDTVVNPSLIVEVLSPSTRNYDLGQKLQMYSRVPTLRHILFVDPVPVGVIHYRRLPNRNWEMSIIEDEAATISLDGMAAELPVRDVYAGVRTGATSPTPASESE